MKKALALFKSFKFGFGRGLIHLIEHLNGNVEALRILHSMMSIDIDDTDVNSVVKRAIATIQLDELLAAKAEQKAAAAKVIVAETPPVSAVNAGSGKKLDAIQTGMDLGVKSPGTNPVEDEAAKGGDCDDDVDPGAGGVGDGTVAGDDEGKMVEKKKKDKPVDPNLVKSHATTVFRPDEPVSYTNCILDGKAVCELGGVLYEADKYKDRLTVGSGKYRIVDAVHHPKPVCIYEEIHGLGDDTVNVPEHSVMNTPFFEAKNKDKKIELIVRTSGKPAYSYIRMINLKMIDFLQGYDGLVCGDGFTDDSLSVPRYVPASVMFFMWIETVKDSDDIIMRITSPHFSAGNRPHRVVQDATYMTENDGMRIEPGIWTSLALSSPSSLVSGFNCDEKKLLRVKDNNNTLKLMMGMHDKALRYVVSKSVYVRTHIVSGVNRVVASYYLTLKK